MIRTGANDIEIDILIPHANSHAGLEIGNQAAAHFSKDDRDIGIASSDFISPNGVTVKQAAREIASRPSETEPAPCSD